MRIYRILLKKINKLYWIILCRYCLLSQIMNGRHQIEERFNKCAKYKPNNQLHINRNHKANVNSKCMCNYMRQVIERHIVDRMVYDNYYCFYFAFTQLYTHTHRKPKPKSEPACSLTLCTMFFRTAISR